MPETAVVLPAASSPSPPDPWWRLAIEGMPDADMAMRRIYAWFAGEIIDRPPVRFMAHNAFLDDEAELAGLSAEEWRLRRRQRPSNVSGGQAGSKTVDISIAATGIASQGVGV